MLLELAGVRTNVVIDPAIGAEDGPPVVLCSGLAGNWFDWDRCTELVSAHRRVIRLDRPGYGLSDPWPDGALPTLDAEVRRLRELLDQLGIDRAVLCGHSMAGFYVEAFVRVHPDRTAAAVLLDSSVATRHRLLLPAGLRDRLLLASADLAARVHLNRVGPLAHRLLVGAEADGADSRATEADGADVDGAGSSAGPELRERILSSERYLRGSFLENGRYPVLARQVTALREGHPLPAGVPVTVAAADAGHRTPAAALWLRQQRRLAELLHARFAVISPSRHHAMLDQPAQTAAVILDATTP